MTNDKYCPYTNKTYLFFFPTISNLKILRVKRYPIPTQNGATEHFGRVWQPIPMQAATISHLAPKKIPHSRAEGCHGAFRAHLGAFSCAGGYNFPFCAEKDTPFPRRRVPRRIPGGFGTVFPRRRLQFSIPRGKRYPIPAQNVATEQSAREKGQIPAQKGATEDSWRKKQLVPAQNVAT